MAGSQKILDTDSLTRTILDPKDMFKDAPEIVDLSKQFIFRTNDGYKFSVNCPRFVGNDDAAVHQLGFELANFKNSKADPKSVQQKYKGYYEASVQNIRACRQQNFSPDVRHDPIKDNPDLPNNPAHCHLGLFFEGEVPAKGVRNQLSSDIRDIFKSKFVEAPLPSDAVKSQSSMDKTMSEEFGGHIEIIDDPT